MAKQGYTWYPKDWTTSESVFELSLIERGLYRELIDLVMINDNNIEVKLTIWSRKFGESEDKIQEILNRLTELSLIKIKDNILFIPSCEPRLQLIRGGRKGGESKPTVKPIPKPNTKPIPKQKEKKDKYKGKEYIEHSQNIFKKDCFSFTEFFNESTIKDFYIYWSEPNSQMTKLKYQLEKTWDTKRRLYKWKQNQDKWSK